MSILSVTFDGVAVTPMRPVSYKNYGSADCPSGTVSVITKAAQILRSMGKAVTVPQLDQSGLDALISSFKAGLSAVDTYSAADEEIKYPTDRTQILNPTATEKTAKIDEVRGFTEEQATAYAAREGITLDQAKDALRRRNGRVNLQTGAILADPTVGEAAALLVDERKTAVVDRMLDVVSYEDLRVALNPTVLKSSTCTIDSDGVTLTDPAGGFVAAGVVAGDIVKVAGYLCKVASRDSATQLTLETVAKELVSATAYKIWRDAFIGQFTFSTQE
jgi:hypothetical protein